MATDGPRLPRTADECRRVAHVFFAGAYEPGKRYYIIASARYPHHVYAVYPAGAERPTVRAAEEDRLVEFGPIEASDPPFSSASDAGEDSEDAEDSEEARVPDEIRVVEHDGGITEPQGGGDDDDRDGDHDDERDADKREDSRGRPRMSEVKRTELRVEWTRGRTTYWRSWRLSRTADAVFLTRGAMEMFFYPHYAAAFGHRYTLELRRSMGDD
jgi:hypothetical protein